MMIPSGIVVMDNKETPRMALRFFRSKRERSARARREQVLSP
jgi:hypothetical protein